MVIIFDFKLNSEVKYKVGIVTVSNKVEGKKPLSADRLLLYRKAHPHDLTLIVRNPEIVDSVRGRGKCFSVTHCESVQRRICHPGRVSAIPVFGTIFLHIDTWCFKMAAFIQNPKSG